jgi:predicted nicotinamide N-methyase
MRSRFDVMVEDVPVGAHQFRIASVRRPEKLLDAITAEEFLRDERLPYWAELWTSAIILAQHILGDPEVRGKSVLELGCGLGLAGIAAARAGAEVTMTDYDEDALLFARWNAAVNLDASAAERAQILLLDWREPAAALYDIILGADIVYERRHFAPLWRFFSTALKPGGRVVLGEPARQVGDDFLAEAPEQGFCLNVDPVQIHRRGRASTVRVVTLRPEPAS